MKYETPYSGHAQLYCWPNQYCESRKALWGGKESFRDKLEHLLSWDPFNGPCHFLGRIYPPNNPWLIIHVAVGPFIMLKCQVGVTEAFIEGISAATLPFDRKRPYAPHALAPNLSQIKD